MRDPALLLTLALGLSIGPAAAVRAQPCFAGVGDLAGGAFASAAFAVSSDGSSVVGESESASGTQAFRWTSAGGIAALPFLSAASPFASARAVSGNGAVVVGSSHDAAGVERAVRWSGGAPVAFAGQSCSSCDPLTEGLGLSDDGLVAVGSSLARGIGNAPLHLDPVRWPAGGTALFDLGNLAASEEVGQAFGASQTGAVIAGVHQSSGGKDAWVWSGAGLVPLARLSATTPVVATAYAVARDASAIVGTSTRRTLSLPGGTQVAVEPQAVRWSGAGYATLESLGVLPGAPSIDSVARGVSPDGAVAVGRARAAGGVDRAFVWDAAAGMRSVQELLLAASCAEVADWQLVEARGISGASAGSHTVVGRGIDPQGRSQGWVAVLALPEPGRAALLAAGLAALAALASGRAARPR